MNDHVKHRLHLIRHDLEHPVDDVVMGFEHLLRSYAAFEAYLLRATESPSPAEKS